MPKIVKVLLCLITICLAALPTYAATCVPPTTDGAGLQACLDSSAPGDTIRLKPGTYVPTVPGVILSGNLETGDQAFNVVIINTYLV